jgi:hypothetical protein
VFQSRGDGEVVEPLPQGVLDALGLGVGQPCASAFHDRRDLVAPEWLFGAAAADVELDCLPQCLTRWTASPVVAARCNASSACRSPGGISAGSVGSVHGACGRSGASPEARRTVVPRHHRLSPWTARTPTPSRLSTVARVAARW